MAGKRVLSLGLLMLFSLAFVTKTDAGCGDEDDDWESSSNIQIRGHQGESMDGTVDECKDACKISDECSSFEYMTEESSCTFSAKTLSDPDVISEETPGVTYYELVCDGSEGSGNSTSSEGSGNSTSTEGSGDDDDDNEIFEFLEDNPEFVAMIGMGLLVLLLVMTAIIAICCLSPKYDSDSKH